MVSRRMKLFASGMLLFLFLTVMGSEESPFSPYREYPPNAVVCWYENWIQVTAKAPLGKGPEAKAQLNARRVAVIKAQAEALKIAMKLPLDSETRMEEHEALRVKVKGIVQGSKVIFEGLEGREYSVTIEVPISGVKGILSEVYKEYIPPPLPKPKAAVKSQPKPSPPPEEESAAVADDDEGPFESIVIDAEEAGAKPAIFPRIVDPAGEPVYAVDTVEPEVAKRKTMARYVIDSGAEPEKEMTALATSFLPLAMASPRFILELAQKAPPKRKRGPRVLRVKAKSSEGRLKADLVVTEETARKLRQAQNQDGVLSQANVVVVVRSDVGGVEGRRRLECPAERDLWARIFRR